MVKLIYLGCLSAKYYKNTCENAIKLIKFLDNEYQVIDNTPCCGALAFHISSDKQLRDHINFVNDWFKVNNITDIVTICAGCNSYFSRYYKEFLDSDFNVNVKHILQFIAKSDNLKKLNLVNLGKKVIVNYHDACHLRNLPNSIIEEPRMILNAIDNIEFKEMRYNKLHSICCGAGGGVYSIFKENSDYNTKTIFDDAKDGEILLTACPFCFTALKRVGEENNITKPVIKFEDFIVKIMNGVDPIN